jgi:hypothetical protein
MASHLIPRLDILDDEIATTSADIKEEKEKLDKLYDVNKDDRDTDRINDLRESIARLSTDKAALLAERKELTLAIATHPNQGQDNQRPASSASGKNAVRMRMNITLFLF